MIHHPTQASAAYRIYLTRPCEGMDNEEKRSHMYFIVDLAVWIETYDEKTNDFIDGCDGGGISIAFGGP